MSVSAARCLFDDKTVAMQGDKMNIVILDASAANPGDLSWEAISKFAEETGGTFTAYDVTTQDQLIERAKDAEVLFTNKTLFDEEAFEKLPKLKYIGVLATGFNVVDLKAASAHGVTVTNVPEYATFATAQMAVALMLELAAKVGIHSASVHDGGWVKSPQFCYTIAPLMELAGKTMVVVGMGKIGRQVARVAVALGMKVIGVPHTMPLEKKLPIWDVDSCAGGAADAGGAASVGGAVGAGGAAGAGCSADTGVTRGAVIDLMTLDEAIRLADVISFHCPLTPETNGLLCKDLLAKAKDGLLAINTARGPVAVEADVSEALKTGKLGGYACDVISVEPMKADNPLLGAPNCIITPHIAWAPKETRARLIQVVADNLASFVDGNPINVVN